ncbi:MAG: hypothetical protein EXS22_04245 [Pedosphaera sp.]|nr:hypothetical protein [Pedosphaera sp.]MSU43238.1 hypothetical protein [Pedosphaera sp.]
MNLRRSIPRLVTAAFVGALGWMLTSPLLAGPAPVVPLPEPTVPLFPRGAAQAVADTSDAFFLSAHIPRIKIEITQKELDELNKDPRKYAKATIREDDKVIYEAVGVHLKGAAGSYRGINDRPALTLNFDKFLKKQTFHGMDKVHLNNSVQDGTYMHEIISRGMFQDAGVPTGRASHALVSLNGRDLGLYVVVEGFDRNFLRRHYDNPNGNLYDGGFCQDLDVQKKALSDKTPAGQEDLKAVWAAINLPDLVVRHERLQKVVDVDRFLTFTAMELITCHWDGYNGNRNNYRLYVESRTGKLHFMASGVDQVFGDPNYNLFGGVAGTLGNVLMGYPQNKERYRTMVGQAYTNAFKMDVLDARVNFLAAKLRPVGDFNGHAAGLKQRMRQRAAVVATQLGIPPPTALPFAGDGIAKLDAQWESKVEQGNAVLNKVTTEGLNFLYIKATGPSTASWRKTVHLPPGNYEFEGMLKVANVAAGGEPFVAAGLRLSGGVRAQKLDGTSDWKKLAFPFTVPALQDVTLVAELRANQGEVWFDLSTLLIRRKP